MLARRIVCRVREGDVLERGQRVGLMKFGSRMDVFLPTDAELLRLGRGPRRRRRDRPGRVRERRCSISRAAAAPAERSAAPVPARRVPPAVAVHRGEPVLRLRVRGLLDAVRLRHGRAAHRDRDGPRHARRLLRAPHQLVVGVRRRARFAGRRRLVRPRAGDSGVYVGPGAAASGSGGPPASSTSPPPRCASRGSTSRAPRPPRRPTSVTSSACRAPRPRR